MIVFWTYFFIQLFFHAINLMLCILYLNRATFFGNVISNSLRCSSELRLARGWFGFCSKHICIVSRSWTCDKSAFQQSFLLPASKSPRVMNYLPLASLPRSLSWTHRFLWLLGRQEIYQLHLLQPPQISAISCIVQFILLLIFVAYQFSVQSVHSFQPWHPDVFLRTSSFLLNCKLQIFS